MKKSDPPGPCMLGSDGVMRTFGPYADFPIIDAVGFSPSQIKQLLDLSEWSQKTKDKFRGVDGREVTDHKALFEPRESDRLKPGKLTQEEERRLLDETDRRNREIREKMERERLEGVDVAEKYDCGKVQSDRDLRPNAEH